MSDIVGGKFRAGLVQTCSGRSVEANVVAASELIRRAAAGGANYVQTPEVTTLMELDRERLFTSCQPEEGNKALHHFQSLARELGIWLHIGSMAIRATPTKLANRSYLLSPAGDIVARYDKIHMFDVQLANGEIYRESENYQGGDKAVVAATPWGGLGMTICYDLRFPYLYRALAHAGAQLISVPAAFTRPTGEAHWHVLLRARAIEAQCFVMAAAQGGQHEHGRSTYGHSLVISPWGEILAEGDTDPGVIFADIDLAQVAEVRQRVPSLTHDRPFEVAAQLPVERASADAGSR